MFSSPDVLTQTELYGVWNDPHVPPGFHSYGMMCQIVWCVTWLWLWHIIVLDNTADQEHKSSCVCPCERYVKVYLICNLCISLLFRCIIFWLIQKADMYFHAVTNDQYISEINVNNVN